MVDAIAKALLSVLAKNEPLLEAVVEALLKLLLKELQAKV